MAKLPFAILLVATFIGLWRLLGCHQAAAGQLVMELELKLKLATASPRLATDSLGCRLSRRRRRRHLRT